MAKRKGTKSLKVHYGRAVYGKEEIRAVVDVLKEPTKIGPGERVKEFETKIARLFGKKHGVMVNSGSSANLMALAALKLPPGSEVITPVLTFGTTLSPIVHLGLVPVFVDVSRDTFLMDLDKVEDHITERTKVIMIPSLLGNVPDMERVQAIAKKHELYIVEDSADTLGATFAGKPTGYYSHMSTTSFYASHVITAAASGGMVCFHDEMLGNRARILASWGRQSTLFGVNEKSEDIERRFAGRLDGDIYDAKFLFTEIGYNLQSNELAAAFGLEQLKKLKKFSSIREKNFKRLYTFFGRYEQFFSRAVQHKKVRTNWLAFPLTVREGAPFTRADITRFLEERHIQTRPVFTGNVLRQPAFKDIEHGGGAPENFPEADRVMRRSFVIGCNHGLSQAEMKYMEGIFTEFLSKYR